MANTTKALEDNLAQPRRAHDVLRSRCRCRTSLPPLTPQSPLLCCSVLPSSSAGLPRHRGLLLTPRCSNGLARRCAQARGLRPSSVRLLSAVCVCANKEIMLLTIEMRRKIEKGTLACAREDIGERVPAPVLSPPVLHTYGGVYAASASAILLGRGGMSRVSKETHTFQPPRVFGIASARSARDPPASSGTPSAAALSAPATTGRRSGRGVPQSTRSRRHTLTRGGPRPGIRADRIPTVAANATKAACFARRFPRAFYRGAAATATTRRRSVHGVRVSGRQRHLP